MVQHYHGAHHAHSTPPPSVRAQQRLQRTLSTRVPLWQQLEELEGLGAARGILDPAMSAPGAIPCPFPIAGSGSHDAAAAAGAAGAAGGAFAVGDAARRNPRRQLQLLQEALCPLTHDGNDLRPHSQPQAQELYNTLLQVGMRKAAAVGGRL